jgi:hypothetical protein
LKGNQPPQRVIFDTLKGQQHEHREQDCDPNGDQGNEEFTHQTDVEARGICKSSSSHSFRTEM